MLKNPVVAALLTIAGTVAFAATTVAVLRGSRKVWRLISKPRVRAEYRLYRKGGQCKRLVVVGIITPTIEAYLKSPVTSLQLRGLKMLESGIWDSLTEQRRTDPLLDVAIRDVNYGACQMEQLHLVGDTTQTPENAVIDAERAEREVL